MSEMLSKPGLYKLLRLLGKNKQDYPIMHHNSGSIDINVLKKFNGGTILAESPTGQITSLDFNGVSNDLKGDWTIAKVGGGVGLGVYDEWEVELIFPGGQEGLLDGHKGSYAKVFANNGSIYYNIHNIYDNVGHLLYNPFSGLKPITKGGKELIAGITSEYTFEENGGFYPVSSIRQGRGRDGNEKFYGAYYYGDVPSNGNYYGNSDIMKMFNLFGVEIEENGGNILHGYAYPLYLIFSKDSYLDLNSDELIIYKMEGENRFFEGRTLIQNLQSLQGYKIYFLCELSLSLTTDVEFYGNYSGSYRITLIKK